MDTREEETNRGTAIRFRPMNEDMALLRPGTAGYLERAPGAAADETPMRPQRCDASSQWWPG